MEGGVAELDFTRLGAVVEKMRVVFPGETHAALHLDAAVAGFAAGVAGINLGYANCRAALRDTAVERPRGVIGRRPRTFGPDQHVGALMLDGLILADRFSE